MRKKRTFSLFGAMLVEYGVRQWFLVFSPGVTELELVDPPGGEAAARPSREAAARGHLTPERTPSC